jgi:membrane-bound lytic murein transglycosylase D
MSTLAIPRRLDSGWVLPAAVVLCVVGCSEEEPRPPSTVPDDLAPLYEMVHEYREDYERGIERIVAGDAVEGKNLLVAATDRLAVAARLCARTPGCDSGVFTEAMGRVVSERRSLSAFDTVPDDLVGGGESPSSGTTTPGPDPVPTVFVDGGFRHAIPLNDAVRAALNDWLTWNRPALMQTYRNYQFLRPSMAPVYEEAGLPEALLFAMLAKETGAKVHAYSRAGAVGPLQFMHLTARRYGLRAVNGFDMRLDPVAAARANAAFMIDQLDAFDDDLALALAAYNGGESRLRRLHRKLPEADFWEPRLHFTLPSETRDYVPQILAAALLFLHPEEFGLEFPEYETTSTAIVLAEEISIVVVTICLGQTHNTECWFRTLRNLNPRLRPSVRSDAGDRIEIPSVLVSAYADHCVGDSPLLLLARELHDADFPEQPSVVRYKVRRGDTLAKIATRHGCKSVRELAAINGIEAPDYFIHEGQHLSVPTCS